MSIDQLVENNIVREQARQAREQARKAKTHKSQVASVRDTNQQQVSIKSKLAKLAVLKEREIEQKILAEELSK